VKNLQSIKHLRGGHILRSAWVPLTSTLTHLLVTRMAVLDAFTLKILFGGRPYSSRRPGAMAPIPPVKSCNGLVVSLTFWPTLVEEK